MWLLLPPSLVFRLTSVDLTIVVMLLGSSQMSAASSKFSSQQSPFLFFLSLSLSLFFSLSLSLSLFPSSSSSSLPSVFSPLSFFLSSLFRFFFVFFFLFYLGGDRHSAIISKLILTSIPVVTSFLAPFMCVFKSFNGV